MHNAATLQQLLCPLRSFWTAVYWIDKVRNWEIRLGVAGDSLAGSDVTYFVTPSHTPPPSPGLSFSFLNTHHCYTSSQITLFQLVSFYIYHLLFPAKRGAFFNNLFSFKFFLSFFLLCESKNSRSIITLIFISYIVFFFFSYSNARYDLYEIRTNRPKPFQGDQDSGYHLLKLNKKTWVSFYNWGKVVTGSYLVHWSKFKKMSNSSLRIAIL